MPNNPLLFAAAVVHGVLSIGHTTKGLEQFKHVSLKQVPAGLLSTIQIGWYEGSVFLAILSVLNYKWSITGLIDGPDKIIAGLATSLLLGFGAKYYQAGDKPTGLTLAAVGALQALGAQRAVL